MTNINKEVWRIIDNDAAIRRNLIMGIINISSLARWIAKKHHFEKNIDAVISAIRRYEGSEEKMADLKKVFSTLKEAKVSTRTKLVSFLLKKNTGIRKKLTDLYSKVDFEGGEILWIFELSKYLKLVVDEKNLKLVKDTFNDKEIVEVTKKLGEVYLSYNLDITVIPGLFAVVANELAANNISIIDSSICHSEHIFIVHEDDLEKTFKVIFRLTRKK